MENLHHEIIGASGTGKSTLLKTLILEHLDDPVIFIDPLGHNALDLLDLLPPRVTNRVCYIDLGSKEFTVGFNPIDEPQLITPAFEAIWAKSWGPRLDWRLYNALAAIHDTKRTILDVPRMFTDEEFRAKVLSSVSTKATRDFWLIEYPSYPDRHNAEANDAILNKIGQFLASPYISAAYSHREPPLTIPKVLKHNYILIVNLNVPHVGEQHAYLYASLLLSKLRTAITKNPKRTYVYLDEFQTFAAHHVAYFTSILRNFGLSLTLSHQLLAQIDDTPRAAILTNTAIKTVFRTSPDDAAILAPYFNRDPSEDFAERFKSLPDYTAWQSDTTYIQEIRTEPLAARKSHRHKIIKESNDRFARPMVPPAPRGQVVFHRKSRH